MMIAHGMGCPSRFLVRALYPQIQETDRRMAKESATPALNQEDVAVLLTTLRKGGRPMTTAELVTVLRDAAAKR